MRKVFLVFLFIFGNLLWGKDFLDLTVNGGDINLLDNLIKVDQLRNFTKNDFRILRNTIFAKYGYKFISKDLQNHFSQFSWYIGVVTNVDDKLNLIDKQNIDLIQMVEKNYPENNNGTKELIGNWYFFGAVADQGINEISDVKGMDRVQIMPNGIYIYYAREDPRLTGTLYGLWSRKNYFSFETVPIGEHKVYFKTIDEYVDYNLKSPTYGIVKNFNPSKMGFNDGTYHLAVDLFGHGSWTKE